MTYFQEMHTKLKYTKEKNNLKGLRNAQLGAAHSIASYATLEKNDSAIIVMPTGSGKTAVLMMAPYILEKSKVLIVTPSIMVRGQIAEDYLELRTLKHLNVFQSNDITPRVIELEHRYSDNLEHEIINSDVIVATPSVALSLSENKISKQIDYVIIDEAHHVPAKTWQNILENMNHADSLLVTATPFRLDNKKIKGEHIYIYPMSKAYKDGIFGEILYIPIPEAPDKHLLIAKEAERVFFNDKSASLEHYLMVRTDTKENAKELEAIYKKHTMLNLKRIDSSCTNKQIKQAIKQLKSKDIDGLICVDMLGEGFDFPNLKIAAIHEPHKSLASTLQFIGRFARTSGDNIDCAKFIAMNDENLLIENQKLFSQDSIWQKIIINMSENKINKETDLKRVLTDFDDPQSVDDEISLYNIKPNAHAKIYRVDGFNLNSNFPEICKVGNNIYRNELSQTIIAFAKVEKSPKWIQGDQTLDVENYLYIIHYQISTKLLFIYSSLKTEAVYDEIADKFTSVFQKISRSNIHRVLGGMQNFEFFNTGMQNKYAQNGESYRIYSGSNTASSIDETTGKMQSVGHAFCKAENNGLSLTIGYSSGSKIWSSSYLNVQEYLQWCDECGCKISNSEIQVKTNTNYDLIPLPVSFETFPNNIVFCLFGYKSYISPALISTDENMLNQHLLIDGSVTIINVDKEEITLCYELEGAREILTCDLQGKYRSSKEFFYIKDGVGLEKLANYFNKNPIEFKTSDDLLICGNEMLVGSKSIPACSKKYITGINWASLNTDISKEFILEELSKRKDGKISIQEALFKILNDDETNKFIIFDHGTGEIADYITIKESDIIEVKFFHVKSMKGKNYNSNLADIYEVFQQAIKSVIWLKSKRTLLDKILNRRISNYCKFEKGEIEVLKKLLTSNKLMVSKICVVQPSINPNEEIPNKYQEVIGAAQYYIKNSGCVKRLNIFGSK